MDELRPDFPEKNDELTKQTLAKGFVFAPEVLHAHRDARNLVDLVNQAYGRSSEELNATFHKSFAKVREASIQQLAFEQMIHYLTTYGAEAAGVYSEQSVFIPGEALEAPELKDGLRLVVIRGLTKDELKAELMKLLGSGIALGQQTLDDALDVAQFVKLSVDDIEEIRNKEIKAALYDHFGVLPDKPVEFLRYVVYRATEKSLLIKNRELIDEIKARRNTDISKYFDLYEEEYGLQRLAEIFYRYKPIFLAFRTNPKLKKTINRIRRLAVANHRPMEEDLLNTLTARLQKRETPDLDKLNAALQDATIFRKIRLAYALKFRTTEADSILYRVRNGKSFATDFSFDNQQGAQIIYEKVLASIINDISTNVEGKKIFIPKGLKYGLPATEKQFTGNLPTGTFVEVAEDMVVGVHWENLPNYRVDLDLSISNAGGKVGWDGAYRDSQNGVYFSGDVTDAPKPKGATEVFHIGGQARGSWLMNLNYYNFSDDEVPFKIVVAHDERSAVEKNYTIDPNKIVALSNSSIDVRQKTLGVIVADEKCTKFYFAEAEFQRGISARHTVAAEQARQYLLNYYTDSIVLNDVLVAAGAVLVDQVAEADIDLSPEAVDKTSILALLEKSV
ncbi:hypothetical protein [Rhodococcus sp. NPDC004095]